MFVGKMDGGASSHIACEYNKIVALDFGTESLKKISY